MQTYLVKHILDNDCEDVIVEMVEVSNFEMAKNLAMRSSMALYHDYPRIVTTLQRIS